MTSVESEENVSNQDPITPADLRIVGVGASAGGLEAFAELLKNLDTDSGMAFVLVQHLDPHHESMLGEILSRDTAMPVFLVKNGMSLRPDQVYVIPPNTRMSFAAGKLLLEPRGKGEDGLFLIDHFFFSLARELKDRSIGVILSGTGTDGAKGIAAIAQEGGATFAQAQQSAKFDGMPLAAQASGADFVQSPEGIAKELARMAHIPADHTQKFDSASPAFQAILDLLKTARSADFSKYKMPTIQRRVFRRVAIHQLGSIDAYLTYLKAHPAEIDALYEDVLIKVTEFFREPESFAALKVTVIDAVLSRDPRPSSIRVWVPGCATGEEAYSIAICLKECIEDIHPAPQIEIFATDISETALSVARAGYYDESRLTNVSTERLKRYFVKEGRGYRVSPIIREPCIFAKQNVSRDPPFSKLDLISCRNLLIYLTPELQNRVLSSFHFALNPGGFLTIGKSETIGSAMDLFGVAEKAAKIYFKKQVLRNTRTPDFASDSLRDHPIINPSSIARHDPREKSDIRMDADRAILTKFIPPGVVVNDRFEVIQFRGDTSAYLLNPPGDVTTNLFKMCRAGLLTEIRTALQEADTNSEAVVKLAWIRSRGDDAKGVSVHVIPFAASANAQKHFVVFFAPGPKAVAAPQAPTVEEKGQIARLERELAETKDYLNAIIEREQAANEELKSASEEILSANEELQSTNEEMATAKEEVQATNEELITVNEEVQGRFQELNRANNDLTNLFGAANIPIVMLSETLTLRRFTQAAEVALNLHEKDVGKSLTELSSRLAVTGIAKLATQVIETLITIEQDIQDRDGRWFSLRIKPYRTLENKIEGAVMVLLDIDSLKRSLQRITVEREYAEAIIDTSPTPLLVLDDNLCVVTATDAFYQLFQVRDADTKRRKIFELGGGSWDVPQLRELLENKLPKDERLEDFVIDEDFPGLGRRVLRLNARRLQQAGDKAAKILIAIDDITNAKQDAQKTMEAKNAAEAANQAKTEFLANMSHEIRTPLSAILGYSEILANPAIAKSVAKDSISRIQRNVGQLTELIDEILDISKIEAGKLEIERIQFPLIPELQDIFTLLEDRADTRDLQFEVSFEGEIPELITSCPMRLRQILLNIAGNALKFTDQGKVSISVKLSKSESGDTDQLCFIVKDTGCGLSLAQQERLFRPFSQADGSVTRKYGGTGLGLVLARRLAQALGGGVTLIESKPETGSTFKFCLDPGPLADVAKIEGLTHADMRTGTGSPVHSFDPSQALVDTTVLLAEDAPEIQALMTHFLEASGATVAAAINGEEALKMALAKHYDLVLMDMQMPILDGYEATKRLRDQGCDTPVVALTANAMRGERDKCLAAGCVKYISKPVAAKTLVEVVARFAKKRSPD